MSRGAAFLRDQRGAVAATYGIALFGLIAIAGVGFDYARMAGLHSELQNGADQAALAAASQLDRNTGACARASAAAVGMLRNVTLLANDGDSDGNAVTFTAAADCAGNDTIRFYKRKPLTAADRTNSQFVAAAGEDAAVRFVEVLTTPRVARYALTPVVDAFNSGNMRADAMAGIGSAICRVPPIMICNPDPSLSPAAINWDSRAGQGIVATGHSPGNSSNKNGNAGSEVAPGANNWSPGNFGFLEVTDAQGNAQNQALLRALAYDVPPLDCVSVDEGNRVSTGNPQGLYDAINTRFGIYDMQSNGNTSLSSCQSGSCTAAPNVRMDLSNANGGGNGGGKGNGGGNSGNQCGLSASNSANGNANPNGFSLPTADGTFEPIYKAGYTTQTRLDRTNTVTRMGLPRDNCHYTTFGENAGAGADGLCAGNTGRFGNGEWAREDYWRANHDGVTRPTDWSTMTRYQTYLWELANSRQQAPSCGVTGPSSRRVMTVAIVNNCSELNGTSQPVVIGDFVDVFLVEPSIDAAGRFNAFRDAIYFEVIGRSRLGEGSRFQTQTIRRDVPYLIE